MIKREENALFRFEKRLANKRQAKKITKISMQGVDKNQVGGILGL